MAIPFDNTYARLPERFYARQNPTPVPEPFLIRVNRELAVELSIDPDWLESPEGVQALSGSVAPEGVEPIAQAYAGHQFGHFVPQLGDGRAILLGEVLGGSGKRYDIQLKGSGRTPFSRQGDGKSALGPVIREYLVSEAMHALGVPTTRALAAVATGEKVMRQEGLLAGGVFTRVASSHIRIGTFQYFAARRDEEAVRQLADYAIERHYPEIAESDDRYAAFIESVAVAQADLIAHWMSLGFIHGVMNTDNMAVSGETIDYGPCAFMDAFHPQCVFSSIDSRGRYAWGNQPDIGLWNLTRLAETLLPLLSDDGETAKGLAERALSRFAERFADQYQDRFRKKLGLPASAPIEVVQQCLDLLAEQAVDFTAFFRRLTQVAGGESAARLAELFSDRDSFEAWFAAWRKAADFEGGLGEMKLANPVCIPRNHRVEQAIQAAYGGDYSVFHRLVEGWSSPFDERSEYEDLEVPPLPEEVVQRTFCGT